MSHFLQRRDRRFVLFDLDEGKTSWHGVGLLAAVFFGSLLIAAVLTPPTCWFAEWLNLHLHNDSTQWLIDKGVDVYFDRLRMISIVLALPWLMSKCHLWSWRTLGLSFEKINLCRFAFGSLVGVVLILGLAWWKGAHSAFGLNAIISALLAGLILGFLEETIFRGLILRIFYTATRQPWLALTLMAAFFAYTHFKVPDSVWSHVAPGVHWDTGFFIAFWTTCGIAENFNPAYFMVLWLLGMVLGMLTLRAGSLLPAIGLHAGIIAAMTFYRGQGLTEGWPAAAALAAIFLFVATWKGKTRLISNR